MDVAHKETDKILENIEKRLRKEYRQATKEVEQKLDNYFAAFRRKDEKKRALLDAGEITQKEYNDWRYGQMCVGKRWEDMRDKLAADLSKTDVIARNIADGYMPEVYAVNHNFATYQIETGARLDTSYTLYDAQSVERLVRDNPDVLPQIGRTTQELIDKGVLKKWNMKNIQSTAIQGILQGESITKLAKRMANDVGASNYKDCVRHARTMTTATQNAGRVDGFKSANDMGIDVVQEWVATIDGRTRHEHRMLDGQRRKVGEPFEVEGEKIMYPADPAAPYRLTMNCRCTLIGQIKGYERNTQAYREDKDLDGMTYDEWKQAKAPKKGKAQSNIIDFSDKLKGEKYAETRALIENLSSEYNTRLKCVMTGAEKAAGDVDITGEIMRINTTKPETAIHEFAHTLANTDADKYGLTDDTDFWKEVKKARRDYLKEVGYDTQKWISSYEHSSKRVDEFLAEAFAVGYMDEKGIPIPDKYGKDLKYPKRVLEIVNRYFKRANNGRRKDH